jgi:hypothetical protein
LVSPLGEILIFGGVSALGISARMRRSSAFTSRARAMAACRFCLIACFRRSASSCFLLILRASHLLTNILVNYAKALASRKLLVYNWSGVFTNDEERIQMATRKSLAGQKTDKRMGRQWLTIRVSPDVRRALEDAAKFSGRAISAEAEQCVEAGLQGERHFTQILVQVAGEQGSAFLEIVAYMMRQQDWLDDATAFATMRKRINLVLDAVAPAGEAQAEESADAEVEALLARLFKQNPSALWFRWAVDLKDRFGSDATRRIMRWIAGRQA